MAKYKDDETRPLTSVNHSGENDVEAEHQPRTSFSSASTTSLILDNVSDVATLKGKENRREEPPLTPRDEFDFDDQGVTWKDTRPADRKARRLLYAVGGLALLGWTLALFVFVYNGSHRPMSSRPHDPHATSTVGNGKKVTLDQILQGAWYSTGHSIRWIEGLNDEDGLLLQAGGGGERDYLTVEDVRYMKDETAAKENRKTLMKNYDFGYKLEKLRPDETWPSKDQKHVLIRSHTISNWRHSSTGRYWIFNVEKQAVEPLDPDHPDGRVQLASWSPQSDAIVFTRDNNLYSRKISSKYVTAITKDGGPEYFYGIPDWVYEEEVFHGASGTWWSSDGKYIAFLRTNETAVPTFPVSYFFSRPSGQEAAPGEAAYPDVRHIKYPKAGAPMSVVSLLIYDVAKGNTFEVTTEDDFSDDNRLITEVVWAGNTGQLLVRNLNRESDVMKVILMDAEKRKGHTVRELDVKKLDGGWFEVSKSTTFIPKDEKNNRPNDGYIDTVIHQGFDHLAYFSPLDSKDPVMLTTGQWEVVEAPSAVDLKNNLVYFRSTQKHSTERHVYSVKLDGTDLLPLTNDKEIAYYESSFSKGAGYVLLSNKGPGIPWQRVVNTRSNPVETSMHIEDNARLSELAAITELPLLIYQTIEVDGFELNVVERRPPHFDPRRKYPVLFQLYNGPGYQEVHRQFNVDFQTFVASSLGYIVVTVDGRGTGYRGRATRCIIRGNIGHYEAHDHIAAAKMWAQKSYVDPDRIAIWGWSYGGFLTLKILETDAGQTFKYGIAVAPVTDWRYYDSVYTERYMFMPQNNPSGYDNSTITNMTALASNVRFLVMHGASDDNVHTQNTLSLLDKLDIAGVLNYDVHIFPDSDHSIYFHNGRMIVYESKSIIIRL